MRDRKKKRKKERRRMFTTARTGELHHSSLSTLPQLALLSVLFSRCFLFCVCLLSVQSRTPSASVLSPTLNPPPTPPTKKERETFYGLLFPVGTISLPQSQACILCLRGSELHKRPSSMATHSWHDAKKQPEQ